MLFGVYQYEQWLPFNPKTEGLEHRHTEHAGLWRVTHHGCLVLVLVQTSHPY